MAVPSSSTSASTSRSPGRGPGRRGRPGSRRPGRGRRWWRPGAPAPRRPDRSAPAQRSWPSGRRSRAGPAGRWRSCERPSFTCRPGPRHAAAPRSSSASRAQVARSRSVACGDVAEVGVEVHPARQRISRSSSVGPAGDDVDTGLGVPLHPPDGRGEPGCLELTGGRAGQHHGARGSPDHDVVVPLHPAGGPRQRRPRAGPRPRRRSSRRRGRRSAGRAGCATTAPPSATAHSWWPRQMPSAGDRAAAAARISCLVGPSQGWTASSSAPIEPPSTISPLWPVRSAGSGSPA